VYFLFLDLLFHFSVFRHSERDRESERQRETERKEGESIFKERSWKNETFTPSILHHSFLFAVRATSYSARVVESSEARFLVTAHSKAGRGRRVPSIATEIVFFGDTIVNPNLG
jgi:hypothetical protein